MKEKAVVVGNRDGEAKVEIIRTSACNSCKACSVGRNNKAIYVWVDNPLKAKIGQEVEIELNPSTILSATFIAYGIPLVAFLLGVALSYKITVFLPNGFEEIFSLFIGLFTMGISFLGVHLFSEKGRNKEKYTSSIVNILE